MFVKRLVDVALEAPVVPSFTRLGHDVRSRVEGWTDLDDLQLSGTRVLLTGGTSGLGRAAATQLARCGAEVTITGRSADRAGAIAGELSEATGATVHALAADMGDLDAVRRLAAAVAADGVIDVVIHNAGTLATERGETAAGHETTIASQVYGPFLLTSLLLDALATRTGRVLTMSSGGMYTVGLTVGGLEMAPNRWTGAGQYAIAKRAQVTLNELWAERHGSTGVSFHAVHPGWADTPGVAESLPTFGRVLGPLLRTPEQGADTIVWLAGDDRAIETNGGFWHDRRQRSVHRTPLTRRSDTAERRSRLWELVAERSGVEFG